MASIVSAWKIDVSERVAASKLLASSAILAVKVVERRGIDFVFIK